MGGVGAKWAVVEGVTPVGCVHAPAGGRGEPCWGGAGQSLASLAGNGRTGLAMPQQASGPQPEIRYALHALLHPCHGPALSLAKSARLEGR